MESDDLRFIYSQVGKSESIYEALKDNGLVLDLKKVN
ncbi:hypothetical protein M0D75_20680 [Shewanella putrefaciens]|nr:hypothetical protein [Shewanella sp. JNE3-1]MCK7655536.1 hypothetical protein [Shewanella sp. JNE4-1]